MRSPKFRLCPLYLNIDRIDSLFYNLLYKCMRLVSSISILFSSTVSMISCLNTSYLKIDKRNYFELSIMKWISRYEINQMGSIRDIATQKIFSYSAY